MHADIVQENNLTHTKSAMDRLVVVKFDTNIANRRLFMIQRKIMAVILYS